MALAPASDYHPARIMTGGEARVRQWGAALLEGSKEVVALVRVGEPVVPLSGDRVALELLGYDHAALAARGLEGVVHSQDLDRVRRAIDRLLSTPGERRSMEFQLMHRSGRAVPVEATGVNHLGDGLVDAVVIHLRQATAHGSGARFSLPPAAALRRSSFLRKVTEALEARDDFAVLALDIDNYKQLLGSFGQKVMSDLTTQAVERLRALLPPGTALGSLAPGEIGVLLPGMWQDEQVDRAAGQISFALGERYHLGDTVLKAVIAIGFVTSERDYASAEDVMTDAAAALTHARGRRGKRRARFQTQMRNAELQRFTLSNALDDAIQSGEMTLHYQPIVSLADGTLAGFEALVRWQHRQRGLISPGEFIPLAEETGLIVPLGKWVMQEACRQMAEWHARIPASRPLEIGVNLSPEQFQEEQLLELVEEVLKQSGLPPEHLKLEITESAVHDNIESAHRAIAVLRLYGVKLALDDFGTGYSSLSYLHELPYDTLKIDRSFVARIGRPLDDDSTRSSSAVVRAIAALARNLELDVVAEGVETAAQAAWLRSNGCEYAQGFYFAKPMSAAEAGQLIESGQRWS